MKLTHLAGLAIAALLSIGLMAPADAQVTLPQVTKINPTDLFQDVVNGVPTAQNQYASATLLAGYQGSLATKMNFLVGGDATTNLFQRGTTGSSVTTTATYGGPDRWIYWSGTGTAMTVSRTTTAADLPATNFASGFKMARTASQTGVIPVCMGQVVETVNTYGFQGQTAEFDFHVTAGATFSAASSVVTAYIITGTGSDEGAARMAFGLNAGGGGGSGWTGQANAAADVTTISSVNGRFAAVGTIPTTATEIGVAICFTPVGTAGANDYIALSGMQLVRNSSLASIATAVVGTDCTTINCTSFDRRQQAQETLLQQRYYYRITDNVANTVPITLCQATTTAAVVCPIQFPVPMRIAPTATASATTAFGDTATAGAPTACTAFAVVASSTSTLNGKVTCTTGATTTAGGASQLVGANTSAYVDFNSEL